MIRNAEVKYPYSASSLAKLEGVHPEMVDFAFELAEVIDAKIIYGVRTEEEQLALYNANPQRSTFDGIIKKSNHQKKADGFGHALDILPLPHGVNMYDKRDPENKLRWAQFDGLCQGIAHKLGIKIRTGFKWRDNMMDSLARPEKENTLPDGNHIELA
jgi:peptidoglycan L-alanyl-D-glutamate endopeptidase CwlK